MKTVRLVPLLLVLLFAAGTAGATPPKEATIRELLTVTKAEKLLDNVRGQMDGLMRTVMDQALQGKTPTPQQQAALDHFRQRMSEAMAESLSWERYEPLYIRLYQQTFTEEELQDMLAFYRSPGGQAMVDKMPAFTENLMKELPGMMADLQPKLQKIQQDFAAEMKAANEPAAKP